MSKFIVDRSLCVRDGICPQLCGRGLIALEDGFPFVPEDRQDRCNACGQCVAFCPHSAIRLDEYGAEPVRPLDPALHLDPAQIAQHLRGRRSTRVYKKHPVSHEDIVSILETARMAPTGGNNQLVQWTVVETPETVRHLSALTVDWFDTYARQDPKLAGRYNIDSIVSRCRAGEDVILRGAPHLVLAATPASASWGAVDSAIALTYFELTAWAYGIGCCWGGYFTRACATSPAIRECLGLAPDVTVQGTLMFGHARLLPHSVPVRKPLTVCWK